MAEVRGRFLQRALRRIRSSGPVSWARSDRNLLLHPIDASQIKPVLTDELRINALEDLAHFRVGSRSSRF
jgi:hypothetical protein